MPGLDRGGPGAVLPGEFGMEREQPGPAIGPFEPAGGRAGEEGAFARDLVRHKADLGEQFEAPGAGTGENERRPVQH